METEQIDVLVLTPLPEELRALRAELDKPDSEEVTINFSCVIWRGVHLKQRPGGGSLVAVLLREKDQISATNTVHLVLDRWSPRCFALIGIAGLVSTKVKLGDVIAGRHVILWDAKRKELAQPEYSLTPVPSAWLGVTLAGHLQSDPGAYQEWQSRCAKDRPSELQSRAQELPELRVGDIASGSATIDSEEMRQKLSKLSRHFYGVETEAAGALTAFHSRCPGAPSILIRGVSDLSAGKSESDALGEGAWRQYAARNAAKLLVFLLAAYKLEISSQGESQRADVIKEYLCFLAVVVKLALRAREEPLAMPGRRLLDLARKNYALLSIGLPEVRNALHSPLGSRIEGFVSGTLKQYLDVMHRCLHTAEGGEPLLSLQESKNEYNSVDLSWRGIRHELLEQPAGRAALKLAEGSARYAPLGFATEEKFEEYVWPTTKTMFDAPSKLEVKVIDRLVTDGYVSGPALEQDGIPQVVWGEIANRLYRDQWITYSGDWLRLTDVGWELLKDALDKYKRGLA